jgi:hypothetical protein
LKNSVSMQSSKEKAYKTFESGTYSTWRVLFADIAKDKYELHHLSSIVDFQHTESSKPKILTY